MKPRHSSLVVALLCSSVLAGEDDHVLSDQLIAEAEAMAPAFVAPAPAATTATARISLGEWGNIINWTPHIPVTAANLPDGRLLTFSSNQRTTFPVGPEFTYAAVWNPKTGAFTEINNNRHDMFCGGTALLPDGRVVINGGRNTTRLSSIFDWRTNAWSAMPNMNDGRWYNTSVAMTDGSVFTVTGDGGTNTAERWTASGGWQRLNGIPWQNVIAQPGYVTRWHPLVLIAPDGRLFHGGPTRQMNWITTANGGSLSYAGVNVPGTLYPKEGCFALYNEGQILVAGGSATTASGSVDSTTGTSTAAAFTIDLRSGTPIVSNAPSMQNARQFCNSVILPNGEVMVIGGNTSGRKFNDTGSILTPEIWNPGTRQWRAVAPMNVPRNYHSLALLLADGRVWAGGGGLSGNEADHRDAQIFTPPQLYTPSGSLTVRPQITQAPAYIGTGTVFNVAASAGVTRFTFIKMSSQTHSVNTDLRFLELPFTETASGQYRLTAHANLNVMTPGYWMLFALNGTGAWSEARVLQVDPNASVSLSQPGDRFSALNAPASLPLQATAPGTGTLAFTAAGLPPGLSLNPTTGLISGSPTTVGTFRVELAVTDGITLATAAFNWTITPASVTHQFANFTGSDAQFQLNGSSFLSNGVLLLTPNSASQGGSAFLKAPLPISATTSFQTRFVFRMNGTGDGADGMTFVLQNQSPIALGGVGSSLGYQGITPSLAIEIDSFAGTGDPNANHLGLLTNGNVTTHLASHNAAFDMENGSAHTLWVDFDAPTQTLRVFLAQGNVATRPATAVMTRVNLDLPALLGPSAWIGFTGATGGQTNTHEVLAWTFAASAGPPPAPPVLKQPGTQTSLVGQNVTLSLQASDANEDPLTFTATNLPPGLTLNPTSGLISGIPTTAGAYTVTVSVTDGTSAPVSTTFAWTISAQLTLSPLNSPPFAQGANGSFTASSQGGANVRYRWDFGDGTPPTAFSTSPTVTHTFAAPGRYIVTLTATDDSGRSLTQTFTQIVHAPLTARPPTFSSPIVFEKRTTGNDRVWVVNPDNGSVTALDAVTRARLAEIPVWTSPRTLALAPDGRLWVVNADNHTLSIIDTTTLALASTLPLPRASRPFGLAFDPAGTAAYLTLEDSGVLLKLDPATGAQLASNDLGQHIRHLSVSADGTRLYVSRFITPPVPGEATANPITTGRGGEVLVVNADTLNLERTLLLAHSEADDTQASARGLPNYLGAPVISPDGLSAWVPSKQDNIKRGVLRDGKQLTHDQTVRAIASRLNLVTQTEDLAARIDFDDAGMPSAAAFDKWGSHLYVALESTRAVAVVNPYTNEEIARFAVGRAPQGLTLSPDGLTLYVHNFMDRSVSVFDVSPLVNGTSLTPVLLGTPTTITAEKLAPAVLLGKQHFYDAFDSRLALQRYISCAACHNDGDQDGRTWDFTGFGEGLRNTITLRGHGGTQQGPLHWTGNFDEVQDFENQIRGFAGGSGLIANGSPHATLAEPNAGRSADLDALAAYLQSLNVTGESPHLSTTSTADLQAGRQLFFQNNCITCHSGQQFTRSSLGVFADIGTTKPSTGTRLGGPLPGLDIPTLLGLWKTGPYLHDGSAATLADAVRAHRTSNLNDDQLRQLSTFLRTLGQMSSSIWDLPSVLTPSPLISNNNGAQYIPSTDTHYLSGATRDIFFQADGFNFARQTLIGDGEIIARVLSLNAGNPWAKAGVMIRENLTAGSRHLTAFITPPESRNGFGMVWRATQDGDSGYTAGSALNPLPHNWVKVTRTGSILTAFHSIDGQDWKLMGSATFNNLPATLHFGLVQTSTDTFNGASAFFDNVVIRPIATPVGGLNLASNDIGFVSLPGSTAIDPGTQARTLTASGNDIYFNEDGFRFAQQPLEGDGEIIARVTSHSGENPWSKAGLMMRETLTGPSRHATVFTTPAPAQNGFGMVWRDSTGSPSGYAYGGPLHPAPNNWLRLVRSGATITSFASSNGQDWTPIHTATLPNLASVLHVGLALTSSTNSALASATFDNLLIRQTDLVPTNTPLTGLNVGGTLISGVTVSSAGIHTLRGAGSDIFFNQDGLQFAAAQLTGDGEIRARVTSQTNTNPWAKAGVMIRETLAGGSRHATVFTTPPQAQNGFGMVWRPIAEGLTSYASGPSLNPVPDNWVRLVRNGDTLTGFTSSNGTDWTPTASVTLPGLPATVFIGLAQTSTSSYVLGTATFDRVQIIGTQNALPPGITAPAESLTTADADLNANGINDLVEYALGTSRPDANLSVFARYDYRNFSQSTINVVTGNLPDTIDLSFDLETSGDLVKWTRLPISPSISRSGGLITSLSWNAIHRQPDVSFNQGFVRLRVTQQGGVSATAPPMGWSALSLAQGTQAIGLPLLNAPRYAGLIQTLSGPDSVTVNFPMTDLNTDPLAPHYLEILDGEHAGHRLEIAALATGRITLDLNSEHSTLKTLPANLIGARMVVRPHQTLKHLPYLDYFSASTQSAQADQVLLHTAQGWDTHWLLWSGTTKIWVRAGDATLKPSGDTIVPPGSGFLMVRRTTRPPWILTGHVRTTPFRRPLRPGNNLLATPWPLNGTPNGWLLTPANGFTAATAPALSDQIQLWNGTGYDGYWLLRDGTSHRWTSQASASLQDVGSSLPLPAGSAFFLKARPETASNGWNLAPPVR